LRPLIALLAAYALGLQLLLAGLVPMPAAAIAGDDVDLTVFCLDHPDQAGAPKEPQTKHVHKTCCVLCGVSFLFAPPGASHAAAYPRTAGRILMPLPIVIGTARRHPSPRLSQGPPHTA
jgi:hypothetical protein